MSCDEALPVTRADSKILTMKDSTKAMSVARLSESGQLTIPAEYRRDFALERESNVLIMQVGGALVLVLYDDALSSVMVRMEAAMGGRSESVETIVEAAKDARAEIARGEFSDLLNDEAAAR